MSFRLRLLNRGLRGLAKPRLAKADDPVAARRNFVRVARLFRMPPYVLHLVEDGRTALHWVSVRRRNPDWVVLYLHGGAYATGSPVTHRALMARIAKLTGLQVVAPVYRLAPEHPAPAAFEDAVAAHAMLIAKGYAADRIILGGDSAGGGLALALLADICAKGQRPAGLFAFSPWTDLALGGDSLARNALADVFLPVSRIGFTVDLVIGALSDRDPRVSPLYAEFITPPPVLLQVGTTEILLDDSRRMAEKLRQAGGAVILSEWPDCPHVWQMADGYLPEARAALVDVAEFVAELVSPLNLPASGN
ncbi:MAG: alpha/beta hydrolase fold domain-containing protein [Paracoccaceae bacterium]